MKRLGIDIGSTTVKVVVLDDTGTMEYSRYERHQAKQAATLRRLLQDLHALYPSDLFETTVCGSGGKPIADQTGVRFVQEVVANAAAVCRLYPQVRTAIELGGQDAKVVFFHPDTRTHELQVSDMRMNGNCAGGTGAFIDEVAKLLDVPTETFNSLAEKATRVYDISGRCGVFAKTDIQPLLIQGAAREDIALSTFHAIAKQTVGGLAQGLQLTPPIIFEGGPLTFNPALVRVFAERLNLQPDDIIRPDHSETIVAYGAAIARTATHTEPCTIGTLLSRLDAAHEEHTLTAEPPLFASDEAHKAFMQRHDAEEKETEQAMPENGVLRVYIGIDSGSTTSKFVLMDEQERVIYRYYRNNNGKPLDVLRDGLRQVYDDCRRSIGQMSEIAYDRSTLKPRVFVTGELLVTYHSGSNFDIERYLERNGMETIFPRITDQLRKDFLAQVWQRRDFHADVPWYPRIITWLFDTVQRRLERIAVSHPLYEKAPKPAQVYELVRDIIPGTLSCGEGWLMAADIAHWAQSGVKSHIILQPFGCLPNHICGRGVIKRLKERYPDISVLPLDLDPDTSYANIENRLQMLIMNTITTK